MITMHIYAVKCQCDNIVVLVFSMIYSYQKPA